MVPFSRRFLVFVAIGTVAFLNYFVEIKSDLKLSDTVKLQLEVDKFREDYTTVSVFNTHTTSGGTTTNVDTTTTINTTTTTTTTKVFTTLNVDKTTTIISTTTTTRTTTKVFTTRSTTSVEISKRSVCPTFTSETFEENVIPKYKLNSETFLSHVVSNGPNNQIVDFRHGIFWSIRLNRTFVVPIFFEHFTINPEAIILPEHRIELGLLSSLVSIISPTSLGSMCKGKKTELFESPWNQLKGHRDFRIRSHHEYHGFTLSSPLGPLWHTESGNAPFITVRKPLLGQGLWNTSELGSHVFNSDAECAMLTHPLKVGKFRLMEEDYNLFDEIIKATPRPRYVRNMARQYISNVFHSKPFMALHWRYDRRDFMSDARCSRKKRFVRPEMAAGGLSYDQACELFKPIFENPNLLSRKLYQKLQEDKIRYLYIATPPEEEAFVMEIVNYLSSRGIVVEHGASLAQFLRKEHGSCSYFTAHFDDSLSTLEQEICYQSDVFYRSLKSTWSSNIRSERRVNNFNMNNTRTVIDLLNIHL